MGPRLLEVAGKTDKIKREFVTARLWGLTGTAPYLHDGCATTITEAIEWHGGEKDSFLVLENAKKQALLHYLRTLHAPTLEQLVIK